MGGEAGVNLHTALHANQTADTQLDTHSLGETFDVSAQMDALAEQMAGGAR